MDNFEFEPGSYSEYNEKTYESNFILKNNSSYELTEIVVQIAVCDADNNIIGEELGGSNIACPPGKSITLTSYIDKINGISSMYVTGIIFHVNINGESERKEFATNEALRESSKIVF